MGLTSLNGIRATSARITIPAWGRWYAEVQLDGEHTITGAATLTLADATFVGTVLSGGPALGRSAYRIVAGAGGWGRDVPGKSYADDAGSKVATVVTDAARAVGETMATVDPTLRTAPNFVRSEGHAAAVLDLVAPRAWYVDEAGVTRLGARTAGSVVGKVTEIKPIDKARQRVTLAADSIATILPGLVYKTITAVDVQHEISADGGLRSTIWGGPGVLDELGQLLGALDPDRPYRGVTEYRVDTQSGKRWNLQPLRASSGMPYLKLVPVRPGVAGCEADLALGSFVGVMFMDADKDRPFIACFDDADSERFVPTSLALCGGSAAVARVGDEITITQAQITAATMVAGANPVTVSLSLKGTITSGSPKVTS